MQSANDSYNGTDRRSMQGEVNQLLQEVNRIAVDTKFNGKTLMDGSGGTTSTDDKQKWVIEGLRGSWLQESEDLVETYYGLKGNGTSFEIIMEDVAPGGAAASVTSYFSGGVIQRHELRVDMADFTSPDKIGGISASRVIAHEMVHGLMADNMNSVSLATWFKEGTAEFIHGADSRVASDVASSSVAAVVGAVGGASSSIEYSANYIAVRYLHERTVGGIKSIMTELKNGSSLDTAIAATSGYANAAAFLADFTGGGGQGYLQALVDRGDLTNADTGAIGGADADGGPVRTAESVVADTGGYTLDPLSGFTEKWPSGFDTIATQNSFSLQVGEKAGDSLDIDIGAATVSALGLLGIDVATKPNTVIGKVDRALNYLNEQRGNVGATLNRLGHLISVNAINIETASDARSRILDADYAQETGELARRQIFIQAGTAMLAQANATPRQVLSLLNG